MVEFIGEGKPSETEPFIPEAKPVEKRYLELTPTSFVLAGSGMFVIGEAKYRFTKTFDELPLDCVATLTEKESTEEFKAAKTVTICFKSPALQAHNTPIGILNLFYCKVFEPVVIEPPAEKVPLEDLKVEEIAEPPVDEDRIRGCKQLVEDCQHYVGQVWRYGVNDESTVSG